MQRTDVFALRTSDKHNKNGVQKRHPNPFPRGVLSVPIDLYEALYRCFLVGKSNEHGECTEEPQQDPTPASPRGFACDPELGGSPDGRQDADDVGDLAADGARADGESLAAYPLVGNRAEARLTVGGAFRLCAVQWGGGRPNALVFPFGRGGYSGWPDCRTPAAHIHKGGFRRPLGAVLVARKPAAAPRRRLAEPSPWKGWRAKYGVLLGRHCRSPPPR